MIDGGRSYTVITKCCFTCEKKDICKHSKQVTRLNAKLNKIRDKFDFLVTEQPSDERYKKFECSLYKERKLTAEEKIQLGFSSFDRCRGDYE